MGPTRVTAAVPTPSHPLHINPPVTSLEFVSAAMHPGGRNNLIKSTIEADPKNIGLLCEPTYSQRRPISYAV